MDINTLRQRIAQRDTFSILETVDVHTAARTVLKEFDYMIEAPSWTRDGRHLVYNSRGRMYTFELATGAIQAIDTGFAIDCNNDRRNCGQPLPAPANRRPLMCRHGRPIRWQTAQPCALTPIAP